MKSPMMQDIEMAIEELILAKSQLDQTQTESSVQSVESAHKILTAIVNKMRPEKRTFDMSGDAQWSNCQ